MELKFPPEGTPEYAWFDYHMEHELGTYPGSEGSFCRTFMEVLDEQIRSNLGSSPAYVGTTVKDVFNSGMEALDIITGHERGAGKLQYNHMKDVCNRMNLTYQRCRKKINNRMVEFLQENDGVIDQWPMAEDSRGISVEHSQNGPDGEPLNFYFAYFGSDYAPAGHKIYRKEGNTPTRQKITCSPSSSDEIEALWDRYKEIDSRYHVEQGTRDIIGILKSACYLLVPILTGAFLVFSLIWYFMGVDPAAQTLQWFQSAETVIPKFLLFVPKWLLSALAFVSSLLRLNSILFWVGTLMVTVLGGFASVSILSRPYAMPVKKSVLAKSKAASRQAWDEYQAAKDAWTAVSDAWNEAYFQHCKKK